MKYFKLNIFASISILVCLMACTADETSLNGKIEGITATITNPSATTRATVIDNPGTHINIYWQGNDHIGLFAKDASNADYSIAAGTVAGDGKTAVFQSSSATPNGNLTAYSPYQSDASGNADAITINFPSEQAFTIAKGALQSDPNANIMLGKGSKSTGLTFCPVMSVLKIGKFFEEDTKLKSIEFRDLADQPVCGSVTLKWQGDVPVADFTGGGKVLTLTGSTPISISKGDIKVFYLIVPSRNYSRGFEVTFITSDGKRTVQTVGTSKGKTLQPGIAYPVGDFVPDVVVPGMECELYPQAIEMTSENLEKITVIEMSKTQIYNSDGQAIYDVHNQEIYGTQLLLNVDKSLNPQEGGWMIFEQASDELPNGGVFRIVKCEKLDDDTYSVVAITDANPFAPFKNLQIGKPMEEKDGEYDENAGVPLNFNGKLRAIVDEYGRPIDFKLSPSGELIFDKELLSKMLGVSVDDIEETRAVSNSWGSTFNTPNFSVVAQGDNAEASFSPKMTTSVRTSLGVIDGELQYICARINPTFDMEATFTLKGIASASKEVHLVTLVFSPVFLGAVQVNLEVDLSLHVSIGGQITLSAKLTCHQDLGVYTISYNYGDGFNLRTNQEPSLAGYNLDTPTMSSGVSLFGLIGLSMAPSLHFYAMAGIGMSCDVNIKAEMSMTEENKDWFYFNGVKFTLGPEVSMSPRIALGGLLPIKWAHNFSELAFNLNFDPWYEFYYLPACKHSSVSISYNTTKDTYLYKYNGHEHPFHPRTSVKDVEYNIELKGKCRSDQQIGLAYYKVLNYTCSEEELKTGFNLGVPYEWNVFPGQIIVHGPSDVDNSFNSVLVGAQPIDTYPAGVESKNLKGRVVPSVSFEPHTLYIVTPVLLEGDHIVEVLDSHDFLAWVWPHSLVYYSGLTTPNGGSYKRSEYQ